mgnify:CR=1 FL=1
MKKTIPIQKNENAVDKIIYEKMSVFSRNTKSLMSKSWFRSSLFALLKNVF